MWTITITVDPKAEAKIAYDINTDEVKKGGRKSAGKQK